MSSSDNGILLSFQQVGKNASYTDFFTLSAGAVIYQLRRLEQKISTLPAWIKTFNLRIVQLFYALLHPSYFSYLFRRKKQAIESRCNYLEQRIRELGIADCVTVLSRSSGGRVSSLIADKMALKRIICLGYPFKHPELPDEPERYLHLSALKTPMLIIQGAQDEYGGLDVPERYMLSPRVELSFFETANSTLKCDTRLRSSEVFLEHLAGLPKSETFSWA